MVLAPGILDVESSRYNPGQLLNSASLSLLVHPKEVIITLIEFLED